jgi:HEAT repeat protein
MRIHYTLAIVAFFFLSFDMIPNTTGQSGNKEIESDINNLYSANANVRTQAAQRLVAIGPSAIPWLLPVLCDGSKSIFGVAWRSAAKALGDLKAEAAVRCLLDLLGTDLTLDISRPTEQIIAREPAFGALLQIGEPAVPTISRCLPFMGPNNAYLALRILRKIDTPNAKAAVESYVSVLENQTRLAKGILADFQCDSDPN